MQHLRLFFIIHNNYRKVLRIKQLSKHRNTSLRIGNLYISNGSFAYYLQAVIKK